MINRIKNLNNIAPITNSILGALGVALALYIILVSQTIFNIVDRKNYESKTRSLGDSVSSLEIEYIDLAQRIDQNLAASFGFEIHTKASFASRASALTSVELGSNEL